MKFKYVKEFDFPADRGFRGSNKMPSKAGASERGMPARVGKAVGAPRMESKPKMGKGQGYAEGGRVPGYDMDRLPAKKPPGRGMDLAPSKPFKGKYEGYANGGQTKGKGMIATAKEALAAARANPKPKVSKAIDMELPGKGTAIDLAKRRAADATYRGKAELAKLAALRQKMGVKPRPMPVVGKTKAQMAAAGLQARSAKPAMVSAKPAVDISDETGQYDPSRGSGAGMVMTATPVSTTAEAQPQYGMRRPMEYAKGGSAKGKKIAKVMREYKEGKLHSGSKKGPVVKNPKQAMAIALSEAGAKKKAEGGIFNDEYMAYESKGPKTRGTARKGREQGRKDRMERLALEKMRRAEKYAPGLSLDMADKKSKGGMPVHRRKPMYGGGKC